MRAQCTGRRRAAANGAYRMTLSVMQVLHQGGGAGSVTSTLHLSLGLGARRAPRTVRVPARFGGRGAGPRRRSARSTRFDCFEPQPPLGERRPAGRASGRHPVDLVNSQSARDREALTWLALTRRLPSAARRDPPADAAHFLLENWLVSRAGRPGRRGQPGRRRGAGPAGHAAPEADGDSQRARHRADGRAGVRPARSRNGRRGSAGSRRAAPSASSPVPRIRRWCCGRLEHVQHSGAAGAGRRGSAQPAGRAGGAGGRAARGGLSSVHTGCPAAVRAAGAGPASRPGPRGFPRHCWRRWRSANR